jgi:hypothetical protein
MADSPNTTTLPRLSLSSAGATRRRFFPANRPALPCPTLSELERAHFRCIAELMTLKPRRIIGNTDRFDLLNRADYIEAFLSGVTVYVKVLVGDIIREFPLGDIDDDTDLLAVATSDITGALKNAVDRMIEVD